MMNSNDLVERDLAVVWHPCSQMRDYREPGGLAPLHVVGAAGCRIKLADGREVLDAISSWWCKSLGHGHPRLRTALVEQAGAFEHVILANTTNEPIVRLSERLCDLANDALAGPGRGGAISAPAAPDYADTGAYSKVFYADNGSTAVEIALKMAIQAQAQRGQPQRTRLAALSNGYHGETAGALSVSDCKLYREHYGPLLFDVTQLRPVPYRSGPDDPAWIDASAEWPAMEAQLDPLSDTLAAIIYEPVLQGAGHMRLYSPDLLPRLRRWADAHDVYLIADEIAAGMGRLGPMLAGGVRGPESGIPGPGSRVRSPASGPGSTDSGPWTMDSGPWTSPRPDFICLSKGLTGGMIPLSAVVTTDAVYNLFDDDYTQGKAFLHSNTYTGHALAVAVAHAALDVYEDPEADVLGHVTRMGPRLRDGLREIGRNRPYLHHIRGCGMMAAADLCRPDGSPLDRRKRTAWRVFKHAVGRPDHPALLRPLGDTVYVFPPLNTPAADLDAMLATLADSLDVVVDL